ncbi:hypothetical protein H4R23_006057, partial [Coemansia sp. Cherry 401B]
MSDYMLDAHMHRSIEELSAEAYGLTDESQSYSTAGMYACCTSAATWEALATNSQASGYGVSWCKIGIVAPAKGLPPKASLSAIVSALQKTYCQNISYEFEHVM